MQGYMGIDVGSVSTNLVLLDIDNKITDTLYLRTKGLPIEAVQLALSNILKRNRNIEIRGVGTTGSGRQLAALMVGADVVKNEITAHAMAAIHEQPDVQTVIEIGGQDSKLIFIRNKVIADFSMNTVCAAGTGSFLDQQAARLNMSIEEFSKQALASKAPVQIAGRCAVFAESDMIHKQQAGYLLTDIINGLCHALVRNYFNNLGKGKRVNGPILFQGGVAANPGMRRAFETALGQPVIIPRYYNVMGAVGAALLAREQIKNGISAFRGVKLINDTYSSRSFECDGCPNRCEIIEFQINSAVAARWGDRCGKWNGLAV